MQKRLTLKRLKVRLSAMVENFYRDRERARIAEEIVADKLASLPIGLKV